MGDSGPLRRAHVNKYLRARGIRDERVLAVMENVPRECFVPEHPLPAVYADGPLPLAEGQTISQPFIVALMTEAMRLQPHARVLEVGTGSGYQTAVLSRLVQTVYTIERLPALSTRARQVLTALGWETGVHFKVGDGSLGWPEEAPFDAVCVTAAAPEIPEPLVEQLARGGRLVVPVGDLAQQDLKVMERNEDDGYSESSLGGCRFVPLWGGAGWGQEHA